MKNLTVTAFAAVLLAAFAASLPGFVLAHAEIKSSNPKDHAHLKVAPKTVMIDFGEGVETKLSKFGVYFMPAESMMKGGKMMTGAQMDDVVEANFKKFLNRKTDGADRVDTGLVNTSAQSEKVTIALKPNLKPGVYIIAWKVIAVDTHTTSDAIHFHFDGAAMPGMK
jgi:copper resistance protein C